MASLTSVISLFILLLAAYSYSVPIGTEYVSSTPVYEFTTGQTLVNHENKINMHLMSDEESTGVPNIHKQGLTYGYINNEVTTLGQFEHHDDVSHPSHIVEDLFFTSTPMTFTLESSSSVNTNDKRSFDYDDKRSIDDDDKRSLDDDKRGLDDDKRSLGDYDDKRSLDDDKRGLDDDKRSLGDYDDKRSLDDDKRGLDDDKRSLNDYDDKRSLDDDKSGLDDDKRGLDDDKRSLNDYDDKRSIDDDDKRSFHDNDLFITVESSTEFDRRAIKPTKMGSKKNTTKINRPTKMGSKQVITRGMKSMESEEFESSTPVFSEHEIEMTTSFEPSSSVEPSSSFNSFGKATGLLHNDQSEEESTKIMMTSTTPVYEKPDQSSEEELTTQLPVKPQRFVKTVSIIPGKITETKIYSNIPSKTYIVTEPVQQPAKHLSQGSTLLLFLVAALLFCAFLMASTIAIVKSSQSLKRRSRITEMEADLDKHYQHLIK